MSLKAFKKRIGSLTNNKYPRVLGGEYKAVREVLRSSQWNMNYGSGLVHERLEKNFAEYVGSGYAIAVNTGGMAIQIALRAMGLKPGDEVIHQVDTCVADSFAIINAGCTPVFADINTDKFMLSQASLVNWVSPKTKVIVPVHMWGNSENMNMIEEFARERNLLILEDAALSLGAKYNGKMVGSFGKAGIFSLGCLKPIQAGEGGIIVTDDEALAKEMKTIRNWGDMSREYGKRDQKVLSWNGRMSEIVAAVALEQLKAYPGVLKTLHENVGYFYTFLRSVEGIVPVIPFDEIKNSAFTQVVTQIDENKLGITKDELMIRLGNQGIQVWHANFEPINTLSFFSRGYWKDWTGHGDPERAQKNYNHVYENSNLVYSSTGLGFMNNNFISKPNVRNLTKGLLRALKNK